MYLASNEADGIGQAFQHILAKHSLSTKEKTFVYQLSADW